MFLVGVKNFFIGRLMKTKTKKPNKRYKIKNNKIEVFELFSEKHSGPK